MGAFAFGESTRRDVIGALANLRPFQATRGDRDEGLVGLSGPYRKLTSAKYGALPREYARGLDDAVYVVYCYGTPIAWVVMADEATEEGRVNFMPDWQYSATTTYYQSLITYAWGSRNLHDPNRAKSQRDNRGTPRGRRSDVVYGRETAEQAMARARVQEARRTAVRRQPLANPGDPLVPGMDCGSGYGEPESPAEWVAYARSGDASMDRPNIPAGADARDAQRVLEDIEKALDENRTWRPAHP